MAPPKYQALKKEIVKELDAGTFKPGDVFPTEKEIMKKYDLSYITVSRAMRELSDEGYFIRRRRKGTIVRGGANRLEDFTTAMPLYINGLDYESVKTAVPLSWFVFEEMQRGIINNYPGPVKIESGKSILARCMNREKIHMIFVSPRPEDHEGIKKLETPHVVIDYENSLFLKHNSIRKEMIYGVYELMAYLMVTLGHRKIGYIGGRLDSFHAERYAMYEIAFRAHDIPFDKTRVIRGLEGYEHEGFEAMKKLMSLKDPPTAVFGDSDILALGAVKAAKELGLDVPGDVAVAGFDDIPGLLSFTPHLTTVRIPCYDIGRAAAEMLLERIKTGKDCETRIINSSLVIRDSCAPLKK